MKKKKVPADWRAILATLAGVAGLGSSLVINRRKLTVIPAALGAFGTLMLLLIRLAVEKEVDKTGAGLVGFSINYGIGYWGALIFFLATTFFNGWIFLTQKPTSRSNP